MEQFNETMLIEEYIRYVSEYQKHPTVEEFAGSLGKTKTDLQKNFESIKILREQIWVHFFKKTVNRLNDSDEYYEYSVRDKMLAFYYTWIEILTDNRKYVTYCFSKTKLYKIVPVDFREFEKSFTGYCDELLEEGKQTGTIASRPLIENKLKKILWAKLLFILKFWLKDKSENSEKTDAGIEKSVHLVFDILSRNAVDTAFDLGKFIVQNIRKK